LGDNPEALVQITEKAAAQVAEALSRRWENKRVDETVQRIEHHMNHQLSRWTTIPIEIRGKVLEELRVVIGKEVNTAITSLVNKAIADHIQRIIDSQATTMASLIEQKALKMVEDRVNDRVLALIKTAMKG
jgi:hypothetical protein